MFFGFWMILLAALLPYFAVYYAKYDPKFDNRTPRAFLEKQTGAKKRAYWAQQNSFEIFPLFAAAVIIAYVTGGEMFRINILAGAFVISRMAYILLYIIDKPSARSIVWAIGLGCIIGLFAISGQA